LYLPETKNKSIEEISNYFKTADFKLKKRVRTESFSLTEKF
jgi:hypothetical protein